MPDLKNKPSKDREADNQPSNFSSERITRELKNLQAEFQKSLAAGDSQSIIRISEQMTLLSKLLQPEQKPISEAEVKEKTNLKLDGLAQNQSNAKAPPDEQKAPAEVQKKKKKGGTGFFDLFFNPEKTIERLRTEQENANSATKQMPTADIELPAPSAATETSEVKESSSFLVLELEKAKQRKANKELKKAEELTRLAKPEPIEKVNLAKELPILDVSKEQPRPAETRDEITIDKIEPKSDQANQKSVADLLMDSLESQSKNNLKALLQNVDGSVSAASSAKEFSEDWRYSRAKQLCSSLVLGRVPLRPACLEAFMTLSWDARSAQSDDDLLEIRVADKVVAIVKLLPRSAEVNKPSLSDICAVQTQYWQTQNDEPKAIILFGPASKASAKGQSLVEQSCEEYAAKRSIALLPLEKLFCISLDFLLNAKDSDTLLENLIAQSGVPSFPALPFEEFPKASNERVAKYAKQVS